MNEQVPSKELVCAVCAEPWALGHRCKPTPTPGLPEVDPYADQFAKMILVLTGAQLEEEDDYLEVANLELQRLIAKKQSPAHEPPVSQSTELKAVGEWVDAMSPTPAAQALEALEMVTHHFWEPTPPDGKVWQEHQVAKFVNDAIDRLRAAQPPGALQAEVERMRKLFWLAKEDVIFFSGYNAKTDRWPDIDLFYAPCVTVNDTFGYACADAQQLDDTEIDRLIDAHKQWGYDGVVAWASLIRKCEPIVERRTPKYHKARSALTKGEG